MASDYGAGGDFRQNNSGNDGQETSTMDPKLTEYLQSLLSEKLAIDHEKYPLTAKLIDQEMVKAQNESKKGSKREGKWVNIYREKPVKVGVKVLVPLKEHPKFNFVGKLLGPKGNSLKRLQEETMCRMAILGRGSMRDREKEDEFRNSLELKYAHLADDLHVDVTALGPPAEAYARLAFALSELRKYLIPDATDNISQEQLREMELYGEQLQGIEGRSGPQGHPGRSGHQGRSGPPSRSGPQGGGPIRRPMRGVPQRSFGPPMNAGGRMPPSDPRGAAGKSNVMSFLNRARAAMESNYDEPSYDEPEASYDNYTPAGPHGGGNRFGASDYSDFGDAPNSYGENQRWKPFKAGGPAGRPEQPRYRSTPYSRGGKS